MEDHEEKHTPDGKTHKRYWDWLEVFIRLFERILRLAGLYDRGVNNALDIRINRFDLVFEDLPTAFDGFTILHISDLHADFLVEATKRTIDLVSDIDADLCVLTGDYRKGMSGPFGPALPLIRKLVKRIRAKYGIYGILGNHDSAAMIDELEELGITMLINETRTIHHKGSVLHVTGTDDVHYYFTEAARTALACAPDGFKIALVHSSELADAAADCGYSLYLCGHTHGGQICLPGGQPIITRLNSHRQYGRGLWRHGRMQGYTTTGIGVSGTPMRFNNRGELAVISLRRNMTQEHCA